MIDFVFVHYHATAFMRLQQRVFSATNDRSEYRIIVVDGTGTPEERAALTEMRREGFIDVLHFYEALKLDPASGIDGSAQHAEGINQAMAFVTSDIVCVQDPDFFYLEKGFCRRIEAAFADPRIVMFGPLMHVVLGISAKRRVLRRAQNIARRLFGRLPHNEWAAPVFIGSAIRVEFLRQHGVDFAYDPAVYRARGYDVAYRIQQLVETRFRNRWVALRPESMTDYGRRGITAYAYFLGPELVAAHFTHGSMDKDSHPDETHYERTERQKQAFMAEVWDRVSAA